MKPARPIPDPSRFLNDVYIANLPYIEHIQEREVQDSEAREAKIERYDIAHMRAAFVYADLSHASRRKVGCVIVKDDRIISIGFNGMPTGWSNTCEDEDGSTRPEVLHAEANAISKLARSTESGRHSTIYITTEPCFICAKLIAQIGPRRVLFHDFYESSHQPQGGVEFLHQHGIEIKQFLI